MIKNCAESQNMTMRDIVNNVMRQDKMTMEFHTPKR